MTNRPLVMKISLNALEHLGMNLYSNVPAVLSEVVANSWDAGATQVVVNLDKSAKCIEITDNGTGMTRDEVIDRFLTVGFKRRSEKGLKTPKGRSPMGRKGIGKLSSFSIAKTVDVYTKKAAEKTLFRMDSDDIKKQVESSSNKPYSPEELKNWPPGIPKGTRIVLSNLKKNLTNVTVSGLRRRIARRFAIIGPGNNFNVEVNGKDISPDDRGYQNLLQYVWTYGDQKKFVSSCSNLDRAAQSRTSKMKQQLKKSGLTVTGWLGTVTKPSQLKDEEGDNLNRIAVFVRGKLAQEDVLDEFGQKEIYADYIVGELQCNELDDDSMEDMATSSRQSLKQDDPRFIAFQEAVLQELRNVAGIWSEWRRIDGTKEALKVPAVSKWMESLKGDTRKQAEKWVGRLNTIRSGSAYDQKELLKASILAFESYRNKDELSKLDEIQDIELAGVLNIFQKIDELEISYYGQIVEMRLGIIKKFQSMITDDVLEKEMQEYLFKHLWLIDPSWERATGTENIESKINNFLKSDTEKLNSKEKLARIDIAYRTTTGKHVIIELKRSNISTPVDKLVAQVRKYRNGVKKILDKSEYANWPTEIICLLGTFPPEYKEADGPKQVKEALEAVDARIVMYDQLVDSAQKIYADYLTAHRKADKLADIFDSIDEFGADHTKEPT